MKANNCEANSNLQVHAALLAKGGGSEPVAYLGNNKVCVCVITERKNSQTSNQRLLVKALEVCHPARSNRAISDEFVFDDPGASVDRTCRGRRCLEICHGLHGWNINNHWNRKRN